VIGRTIGPYQVLSKLGEGGMGEVFRAVDVNLGRAAAIKVLPASLAGDAERLARFEREAQTLALLNHPNIAQVFGFEKGEGSFRALVM
jgi:serine/threonine protein kinase